MKKQGMKKQGKRFVSFLLSFIILITAMLGFSVPASADTTVTLNSLAAGDTVQFADLTWIVLDPAKGYLLLKDVYSTEKYNGANNNAFETTYLFSIAAYLNNRLHYGDSYDGFSSTGFYEYIVSTAPASAELIEVQPNTNYKIGLLSSSEYNLYKSISGVVINSDWWTSTPGNELNEEMLVIADGSLWTSNVINSYGVRPSIYLNPSAEGIVIAPQAPSLNAAISALPGTVNGTTTVTASPNNAGNTLKYLVSTSPIIPPEKCSGEPAGLATSRMNLEAVSGNYIGVYEVNASNKVAAFSQIQLTSAMCPPAAPTINPNGGGPFSSPQTVSISDIASGEIAYYTTDNTDPWNSSTKIEYTGPFTLNQTGTVKIQVHHPVGGWSKISSAVFTFNSAISPTTAIFDQSTESESDVPVTMTLNGNTLLDIKNGTTVLTPDTDYTVSGSTVTIQKSYLAAQSVGTTTLTFNFNAGSSAAINFTVTKTGLQDSVISPITAIFDKNTNGGANVDVPVPIFFNGNHLLSIKNGTTVLTPDTDYTVSDNSVTILKSYLAAQSGYKTTLTFEFSGGNTTVVATFNIIVQDTIYTYPRNVVVDADGNQYFSDYTRFRAVMVVAKDGVYFGRNLTAGKTYVVAGTGDGGQFSVDGQSNGDGGSATQAQCRPYYVALDAEGNLYFVEKLTGKVRMVAAKTGTVWGMPVTAGNIYTVAGNGSADSSGDGGPATEAGFLFPSSMTIDADGNLYISEQGKVRMVAATTGDIWGMSVTAGNIYTIAQNSASLALDKYGNLYMADSGIGNVVRKMDRTTGSICTVAGGGNAQYTGTYYGDGGSATQAELNYPSGIYVDEDDNLYIADSRISAIREVAATDGTQWGIPMTAGNIYTILATNIQYPQNLIGVTLDTSGELYTVHTPGTNDALRVMNPFNMARLSSILGQSIKMERDASGDKLFGEEVGAGTLDSPKEAWIDVPYSAATVALSDIVATSSKAPVTLYGTDSTFTTPAVGDVSLMVGSNIMYVKVVSQDGSHTFYYKIAIDRDGSSDASLATVLNQPINITAGTGEYGDPKQATINVDNSVTTVGWGDIIATNSDALVLFCGTDSLGEQHTNDSYKVNLTENTGTAVYIWVDSYISGFVIYKVTINRAAAPVKSISVDSQSGTITAGTAGFATFAATTPDIADGIAVAVNWCDAGGNSASTPTGLSAIGANIASSGSTITVTADTTAAAGTYYFTVTSDGVTSDVVTLAVSPAAQTPADTTVNIAAIPDVTVPAKGAVPVGTITETEQYMGTVAWDPADNPFAANTAYTATITLAPKAGYTLNGVAKNFFTVEGALSATNAADSDEVTAVFPVTEAPNSAVISPVQAVFDLDNPIDVVTAITWGDAKTVTEVVYGSDPLETPADYTIDGNTLTISDEFLSGLNLSEGDTVELEISFDAGDSATLTIEAEQSYVPGTDASLSDLTIGGSTVNGFAAGEYEYAVELPYGTQPGSAAAMVGATAADPKAAVSIIQAAELPGNVTVAVTAEDDTTTQTYTINLTLGETPNTAPVRKAGVLETAATGVTVNMAYTLNLSNIFEDADADTLTYKVSVNGGAAIGADENYSYTPTSVGQTTLEFAANDGRSDSSNTYTVTLTANAAPAATYTVTFVDYNGTVLKTETVEKGKGATAPANPTRTGYTFTGWYEDESLTTEFDFNTAIKGNTTIYAKWTENPRVLKARTGNSGDKLILTFSKAMADPAGNAGVFSVSVNHAGTVETVNITGIALETDTQKMALTLASAVANGDVVVLSYNPGTIASADGAQLGAFTGQPTVNYVPVPIVSSTVVVSAEQPNQSITASTPTDAPITVTIPETVEDAGINIGALLEEPAAESATVTSQPLPALNVSATVSLESAAAPVEVKVAIPEGTTVSVAKDAGWDGTITMPTVKENSSVTVTPEEGGSATVESVIEVGYGDVPITFNKAVRLLIPGQAGKKAGYVRKGIFYPIGTLLSADSQSVANSTLGDGEDGYINVGPDMIIWTKHFTQFVTYSSQAAATRLDTPAGLSWDSVTKGKATWTAVLHAASYSVQLKKDGSNVGSAVSVSNGTEYDFTNTITANGSGTYTFTVTAVGDGTNYSSSEVSGLSSAYIYTVGTQSGPSDRDSDHSSGSTTSSAVSPTVPSEETSKAEITTAGNMATTTTTATVDNSGKATAAVTQAQVGEAVSKAAEAAAKQGNGTVAVIQIKVEALAAAKTVEVSLPKTAVDAVASSNTAALTVSTPIAAITFDSQALDAIAGQAAEDVKISAAKADAGTLSEETQSVVGDRPVYDFSVTSGGKVISQFGGNVSVSVPYTPKAGEDTNAIVIYYINAEGKPEIVSNCFYDPATDTVSFTTNHFSQYAVGYNKVSFKDVAENAWYNKVVSFIAARGITAGTGNGKFNPEAKLTRGEFIVMLMKAYGITPDANWSGNFADAGSTYYTGYLAAAKRLGISSGVGNNMFAPSKEITRQEMFTLLYNTLKVIGELPEGNTGKPLSAFSDARQIVFWAKDAMTLMTETGTIIGSGGKLSPTATTTRAEMAQVLYNLLAK